MIDEKKNKESGVKSRFLLFLVKGAPNSQRALRNLRRAVKERSDIDYEVIDVLSTPEKAFEYQVYITPMLIRIEPEPENRTFGDLSDDRVLMAELDLEV